MRNLGTLSGDFASLALGINDKGQAVGSSFNSDFVFRAFLWENGRMTDLNLLVRTRRCICSWRHRSNANGEIVGFGQNRNGEVHGYIATRTIAKTAGTALFFLPAESVVPTLPTESARKLLFERLGIRRR